MPATSLEMKAAPAPLVLPAQVIALAAGIVLACATGVVDACAGARHSLLALYLIPVIFTTWLGGRLPGVFLALFAGVCWYFAQEYKENPAFVGPELLQNAAMRIAVFLVVSYLVLRLETARLKTQDTARIDPLTGIGNRQSFFYRGAIALGLPEVTGAPLALAVIDIDGLNALNRARGQQRGDLALTLTAHALRAARGPLDVAARIGGDEFALLMPATDPQGARDRLNALQRELDRVSALAGCPVNHSSVLILCAAPPLGLERLLCQAEGSLPAPSAGTLVMPFDEAAG
ncbi:hypothetical protein BH11PLA1_BH11PLA1_24030 [soil metagenome]